MQVLLTACRAFAQAKSKDMSQNIKWGIKRGFEKGTSGYAEFVCFGYRRGDDGRLAIDEADAKIVRKIFEMRAAGHSLGAILGRVHISTSINKSKIDKGPKDNIKLIKTSEKTMKRFDTAKKPLNLIALFV